MRLLAKIVCAALTMGASPNDGAMTVGEFERVCTGSDAGSKTACRFYVLGIVQGSGLGVRFEDGELVCWMAVSPTKFQRLDILPRPITCWPVPPSSLAIWFAILVPGRKPECC